MSVSPAVPASRSRTGPRTLGRPYSRGPLPPSAPFRFPSQDLQMEPANHSAELFYLQKQIQSRTPMIVVLEDGERIEGCIEWYDRNSLKVRGRGKNLIYKSAIKYMYKVGDAGK